MYSCMFLDFHTLSELRSNHHMVSRIPNLEFWTLNFEFFLFCNFKQAEVIGGKICENYEVSSSIPVPMFGNYNILFKHQEKIQLHGNKEFISAYCELINFINKLTYNAKNFYQSVSVQSTPRTHIYSTTNQIFVTKINFNRKKTCLEHLFAFFLSSVWSS